MPNILRRKVVIVGDDDSGKSALLATFSKRISPDVYVPEVFDNFTMEVKEGGHRYELAVWSSSSQGDYDRLRPLSYPDSNVILIVFAIESPDSLENVHTKWFPEVHHFCAGLPIILVGCKRDLRKVVDTGKELKYIPVSTEEGMAATQKIGAYKYLECSPETGDGVCEVFGAAARATRPGCGHSHRHTCVVL